MTVYFDYVLRDETSDRERIFQISEAAGVSIDPELADKIGNPFIEVVLTCSLDTKTGAVMIHGAAS